MFRRIHSMKGQNTAEYAILIGVIVAAAIAMQVYVRRGMQARIKDAVDFTLIADAEYDEFFNESMVQYEPYYMSSELGTTQAGEDSSALALGGGTNRTTNQNVTRDGSQNYTSYTIVNQ